MNLKDAIPANPYYKQAIADFTLGMPVVKFFGLEFTAIEHGSVELEIPYRDELSATQGMLQGGPVGTLIDLAACAAVGTTLPEGWSFSTIDFTVKFTAPALGSRFRAKGQVISMGRTLSVGESRLFAVEGGEEKLCAVGMATTRNFPLKPV